MVRQVLWHSRIKAVVYRIKNSIDGRMVEKWLLEIEENVSGTPRIYVDNTRFVIDNDKYSPNSKDAKKDNTPTIGNE